MRELVAFCRTVLTASLAGVIVACSPSFLLAQTKTNIALNKPATASSVSSGYPQSYAFNGSLNTRWSSNFSDPQWIYVDLGSTQNISEVKLTWEAAYGKAYQIQVSNDAINWTSIYSTTTGTGGVNDLAGLSGTGRYVRMYGTQRGTSWGYSLWEFGVYGTVQVGLPTVNLT
jgi:hexosaminidase